MQQLTFEKAPFGNDTRVSTIQILQPSNFHAHLRRDAMMRAVAYYTMRYVLYLLAMPNNGPVRTIEDAVKYYDELMQIAEKVARSEIKLIMTLYLTNMITPAVVERMAKHAFVRAIKSYPAEKNLTTGSGEGIPLLDAKEALRAMEVNEVRLLVHCEDGKDEKGETLLPEHGEAHFIKTKMWPLRDMFPKLRICVEHASTIEAVQFVKSDTSGRTAMTVTPHHPLFILPDLKRLGDNLLCKPRVQTPENREAIRAFMVTGDPRVIAGDDTAPHPSKDKREKKSNGCFVPHALGLYARAFDEAGAFGAGGPNSFERFVSTNGPDWWNLPRPTNTITIVRECQHDVPDPVRVPEIDDTVQPLGWGDNGILFHPGFMVQ